VGGVWGRCCGPSAGVPVTLLVASRLGREAFVFREGGVNLVRGGVGTVCHGAGRCWRRDGLSMPCRSAWRARPGEGGVHGNAVARSAWSGRPRWHMSAWSGRLARSRSGDPVSGNWFHGSRLARWRGDIAGGGRWRAGSAGVASVGMATTGRRGVLARVSARWGCFRGVNSAAHSYWG
jgi:hypothetical protein